MRNLLKFLFIMFIVVPFGCFAREIPDEASTSREVSKSPQNSIRSPQSAFFLPANNLDILHTDHMLGYVFKWYQDEFNPHSFFNPFVVAAVGRPANGIPTTVAEEVNEWIFYSTLIHNTQSPVYTLESRFKKGKFEPIMLHKYPLPGVEFLSLTEVDMMLEEAIDLMQKAGFTDPFIVVDLFKPPSPSAKEIVYVFTTEAGRHIFVGTVSKEVFTEENGKQNKAAVSLPSNRALH